MSNYQLIICDVDEDDDDRDDGDAMVVMMLLLMMMMMMMMMMMTSKPTIAGEFMGRQEQLRVKCCKKRSALLSKACQKICSTFELAPWLKNIHR